MLLAAAACRPAPIGRAAATFVPAQTLRFQDAAGAGIGRLTQATDGVLRLSLSVVPGATDLLVTLQPDGHLSATVGAPPGGRPAVSFVVGDDLAFGFLQADGRYESVRGRGVEYGPDWPTVRRAGARLYHLIVPWTPGVTLDDAIPDQDAQFIDKDGRTFAVLGLSSATEPSLALFDGGGHLRIWAAWAERQWPAVRLLDGRGEVRVALRFGPQPLPHVTVWDHADPDSPDRLAPYGLDTDARLEVASASGGWLSWFPHAPPGLTLPMRLIDQRGRVVWEEK